MNNLRSEELSSDRDNCYPEGLTVRRKVLHQDKAGSNFGFTFNY